MRNQRAFLFTTIVLAMVSVAGANLNLTVNGIDTTEEAIEIEGKDNLIIAAAGDTKADVNTYSISATGGVLEVHPSGYLFNFEDELRPGTVSMIANDDMAIDGTAVEKGSTIFELDLFYIPQIDKVIVFSINLEALNYTQPKSEPEQQVPTSQTLSASGGPGIFLSSGAGDCNEVLDPNVYPNLNNDSYVNFEDFAILATDWLLSGSGLEGDISGNEIVDFNDLEILTYYWLANACGLSPEGVFESFKTALAASDVNKAVSYVAEISAEKYHTFFEELEVYLPQMASEMGTLILIRQDEEMAYYDLLREESGEIYAYPVIFVKEENGGWKIYDF